MEFFIQMGHGMQGIARELCREWGDATVIVSPRNIIPDKLAAFSQSVKKANGAVLFDPQFYTPRKHHKILSLYDYWPTTGITQIEGGACASLIGKLAAINERMGTREFILPATLISKPDELWDKFQSSTAVQARKATHDDLLHTIALGKDVLLDSTLVEMIVQFAGGWDVDGIYLVCEHPERRYLVDQPLWLANMLALVAGIKRLGKRVVVGYASHQLLCLSMTKCDAIAAGNFLNVRWFQPKHFETQDNDEISRRARWFYCPQTLSEYKVSFLDVAKELEKLSWLQPPPDMANRYSGMLFGGALPSSVNYTETDSHCHYLASLRAQCRAATKTTYQETKAYHWLAFETAERLWDGLRKVGIRGQDRDFGEFIDVNRAAISLLDKNFGFALSQEWHA